MFILETECRRLKLWPDSELWWPYADETRVGLAELEQAIRQDERQKAGTGQELIYITTAKELLDANERINAQFRAILDHHLHPKQDRLHLPPWIAQTAESVAPESLLNAARDSVPRNRTRWRSAAEIQRSTQHEATLTRWLFSFSRPKPNQQTAIRWGLRFAAAPNKKPAEAGWWSGREFAQKQFPKPRMQFAVPSLVLLPCAHRALDQGCGLRLGQAGRLARGADFSGLRAFWRTLGHRYIQSDTTRA